MLSFTYIGWIVNNKIRMYKNWKIKMNNFVHSFCYTFNIYWRYDVNNKINKLKQELMVMKVNEIKPNYSKLGRLYGLDRRTIKKYDDGYEGKPINRNKESKLDKYREDINIKINLPSASINGVFQYFKENYDDIGTYSNFYKYIKKHKLIENKNNKCQLRYETEYGKQLQFDWKEDIKMYNKYGEIFEFNIFSATLSASRLHIFKYSKYKTRIDVQRCLIQTFQYIGGITEETLTDNMSSIVNTKEKNFIKNLFLLQKILDLFLKSASLSIHIQKEKMNRVIDL